MTLSQPVLDAVEAAAKAADDGTTPTETIRAEYLAAAETLLAGGKSEAEVIAEFNQMSKPEM